MISARLPLNPGPRAFIAGLALLAALGGLAANANAATYRAYAPPNYFGDWTEVGVSFGVARYSISVSPVGNTVVASEVRYFAADGREKIQPFHSQITIETGNSYGRILVRCKGIPLGSAVNVNVSP